MPRLPRTPLALVAAALATVALAAPASAAGDREQVVGGKRLASRGIVVDPAAPKLPEVAAESWLVADLDTGQVLAAKDPHGMYAPASTLKTLTALTLIPVVEPTRRIVPVFEDVNVDGSKVGIVERVAYPASELFSALLMVSGNDAANALATAAGGQEATAALMNAKAQELGALDTRAVNPHGLDATGQVSSAYDLALISRAGLENPDFARYLATRSTSLSGPGGKRMDIVSKNKLLKGYPGTIGGKNGFTSAARASYVGAAARGDRRLLVSLMKSTPKVFDEAAKLFDWGFAAPGAAPVGELVAPAGGEPEEQALPTVPASRLLDPPSLAAADGTGLPVTLAGMALAAAAVSSVRHRPSARATAASRSPRPPARRPTAPARRSAPHTPAQATRSRPLPVTTPSARTVLPRTPVGAHRD